MTELTDKLEKVIQQAAIDGALTKEAVGMFHGVLEDNEELRESLEKKDRLERERVTTLETANSNLAQATTKLSDYQTRERELEERETKITRLEIERKCADLRVEDHKEMVKLIFRNLEVRRNVFPVSPSQHINEQGISGPGGFVEEREQTEKTE